MKYDITHALQALKPGSQWTLFGDNYSGLEWLDNEQTKPTETEINSKISALDDAEPMKLLREERNKRLSDSDWMSVGDRTQTDLQKAYRQALRDLPANASPKLNSEYRLDLTSVTWPTEPA